MPTGDIVDMCAIVVRTGSTIAAGFAGVPRGVRKQDETWDGWCSHLAPSKELHADFYGKNGPPITWEEYRRRYLEEIQAQQGLIEELAQMVTEGKTITLLCSSACTDEAHCHRSLLRQLIEERLGNAGAE